MIRFAHPEAFLLAPIVALLLARRLLSTPPATVLRVLVLLLVAGALAGPYVEAYAPGRDLVLVVDRSRSVPDAVRATVDEVADRVAEEATAGDRVARVDVGREARVVDAPREGWTRTHSASTVDPDGTDLAGGIDAALGLIPPGRQGSVLLVSDGEATGGDAEAAARRAARRGVRVDVVPLRRAGAFDAAVDELTLPADAAVGEPFQFSAWVRADRPFEGTYRLRRDGALVAEGRRAFRRGLERLVFRDVVAEPGVHEYTLDLETGGDRVPENDRARAVLRVEGAFRVLCVTPQGREDRLTRSLRAAGLDLVVAAPEAAPLTLDALDGFRAVVLEDVPAPDLPPGGLAALARWVTDFGGGLLMTGGRASYGPGGYHLSPVEEVLPVSLEMRAEHRKFALAMAIALDRSGSMSVDVGGGLKKMDLANQGTCAAVEMLNASDSVAVIAVDSQAHLVVPMGPVSDRASILARVRSIESMGGGIFVQVAIEAAAGQLSVARQGTRHILLFADAADSEEPGDYKALVPALRKAGVTLSVIGLGSDKDSDAALLREIATLGGGRCMFVADAAELPRAFAQETIQVARSAMIEEPCAVEVLPDVLAVGALAGTTFPSVGGYTIAYLRPTARAGLRTQDEQRAPLLSFWQRGLGRAAAFLGVADGPLSGGLATWEGYGDHFSTLVRWVAGSEASDAVFAEAARDGHEGVLAVEVEEGREDLLGGLVARAVAPDGGSRVLDLRRTGARTLEARFPLTGAGVHRLSLDAGDGRFLRVPPLVLPYSPEFAPRSDPGEGEATLARLARIAGGRVDPPAGTFFEGPRAGLGFTSLLRWFALAALVALLLEIAVRRLGWQPRAGAWWRSLRARAPALRLRRRAKAVATAPKEAGAAGSPATSESKPAPDSPPAPTKRPPSEGIADVIDRATKRRDR